MRRLSAAVLLLALPIAAPARVIEEALPGGQIVVTASSTFSPPQDVRNLVNGSGLADDLHDNEAGSRTMWHSTENPAPTSPATGVPPCPAWVRFDLREPTALAALRIWNHNQAGLTDRGFRQALLLTSDDGVSWKSQAIEIPRAPGTPGAACSLVVPCGTVKSVILAAQANYGSACYGLSEVQFMTRREVDDKDLPFPARMECTALPHYGHRTDGQPGRAIALRFPDVKLYGDVSVEALGEVTGFTNLHGVSALTLLLPAGAGVTNACQACVVLRQGQRTVEQSVEVPPKRHWTVLLFPHSHVDIGYTNPQDVVEKIHVRNIDVGMELGKATENYPEGARHVWNNEVMWAVESWINQATPDKKRAFVEAVRKGQIGLSASYCNANTSTASDEELLRLFAYARQMRKLTGTPIDTMCQFDIPGLSWGVVQAAAQNGVRAILDFPNPSDRVGSIHVWRNKHFRWVAPDGVAKVLYIQVFPYNVAWKLGAFNMDPRPFADVPGRDRSHFANTPLNGSGEFTFNDFVFNETAGLEKAGSPYDVYPCAWSLSDNCLVDVDLPDYVKTWNEKYAFPRLVIASAATIADTFEKRFGAVIPEHRGDLTEYWTDGLGTDARRVGYNRPAKETLVQAETLRTMIRRGEPFPTSDAYASWRWIQLGTEHTWGYMMPDQPIAKQIEATKASFFENARRTADELLARTVQPLARPAARQLTVFNTLSWTRTGLATLPQGAQVPGLLTQSLADGTTVFLAQEVPALGSKTYPAGQRGPQGGVVVGDTTLENEQVKVELDLQTGNIAHLLDKRTGRDFVNPASPYALNSFRYLRGGEAPDKASGPTDVTIAIKERGPLVASLLVESKAEGCNRLTREIRVITGMPHVEILNTVDKISTRHKEGIHFGFAFNVPGATTRMDIPWGVMNPRTDQLDGANKNWLACQRWIDISGPDRGVTWTPFEASIVQFGDITANLLGAVPLQAWRKELGDTSTIVSWALNNHWHTNFPLEQGGVIRFHYAILPHGGYDPVVAQRFGLEQNRPLIAVPVEAAPPIVTPVALDNPRVFVSTLKPSEDGEATILRLRSVSDRSETAHLSWPAGRPKSLQTCLADEKPLAEAGDSIELPPYGLFTLRMK